MGSRQMDLNEGVHGHLSSCTCMVGVAGDGCRYRVGVVEKGSTDVGGQGDSQEWGWGGDGVETGACIFGEFELWLAPAELTEYWCDVCTWKCTGYRTGYTVWTLPHVCR